MQARFVCCMSRQDTSLSPNNNLDLVPCSVRDIIIPDTPAHIALRRPVRDHLETELPKA
jgi:hypothetical protein